MSEQQKSLGQLFDEAAYPFDPRAEVNTAPWDCQSDFYRAAKERGAQAVSAHVRAEMRTSEDEAYSERNKLVAYLARLFPSGLKRTEIEGWHPEWHGCVFMDTPCGQLSWHYHDDDAYLFEGLPPYAGSWDGHTTPEKYGRLQALRARAALSKEAQTS